MILISDAQVGSLSETLLVGPPLVLLPSCEGLADVDEMETNEAAMAALCQAHPFNRDSHILYRESRLCLVQN